MGWENYKVVHQRLQLVEAYIKNEASMTEVIIQHHTVD